MTSLSAALRHTNVVCPFCGLGCDDLEIASGRGGLRVERHGCPISTPAYAEEVSGAPAVRGRTVSLPEAVARAASVLGGARSPLIMGLGTDVAGARAAVQLAEKLRAVVDHMHGEALCRNIRVLQDTGWVTSTLSEVRNRADLLLFFGSDVSARFPRFFERVVFPPEALFAPEPRAREIVVLGPDRAAFAMPDGREPWIVPCERERLGEVAGALRCLVRGQPLQAKRVADVDIATLRELAARLKTARYAVIVWAAGQLGFPHADIAIEALAGLIEELNRVTRCAGLPLAGRDGDVSANQVATWQTGFPLPLSFARGYPEHDPYRFAGRRLLERGRVDALLWISAFDATQVPPGAPVPTVALGRPGMRLSSPAEAHIPVATPGRDHAGQIFRCDGVVALPLRALRATDLPSVAQVLGAIEAQLGGDS